MPGAAFLTLAAVATVGLVLFFVAMPETGGEESSVEPDTVLRDKSGAKGEGAFLPSAAEQLGTAPGRSDWCRC